MLPSKYLNNGDSPCSRTRNESTQRAHCPPLGITGVLCVTETIEIRGRGTLTYTVYRPSLLQSSSSREQKMRLKGLNIPQPNPPLVCVAGGPGLGCQYLTSLVHMMADRAIVLYDHMGCGQSVASYASSCKCDSGSRSFLDDTVSDLALVISKTCGGCSYHVIGHSLGGIIAFEYLKNAMDQSCLSVILASTPTNIQASKQSSDVLLQEIGNEIRTSENENLDDEEVIAASQVVFQRRHECRMSPTPLCLQQSLACLKNNRKLDQHVQQLQSYEAGGSESHERVPHLPPALVVRGQYDFVSHDDTKGWDDHFHTCQHMTVSNCSHYGMVEQEDLYANVLVAFLSNNDCGKE